MIKIRIDKKELSIKEGSPVILAARKAGIEIPAMCWREGKQHITSCMICMVKDAKTGKLFPSCSVEALDGMDIITMDEEIHESRKTALELLLSEHVGDCEAPCQITCPAHMDIPQMNRLLANGEFDKALDVVYRDIPLPGVFGRICPAPCEGACRRKSVDEAVSICLLKRASADFPEVKVLAEESKTKQESLPGPLHGPLHGRIAIRPGKVSILGAGPAGLAAAFYLSQRGYSVKVFDQNDKPGGSLERETESGKLPVEILNKEIEIIKNMGAIFLQNTVIDKVKFDEFNDSSDALIIATGSDNKWADSWGLEMNERGIVADKKTFRVGESGIFVIGSALRPTKLAIRTLGQGKEVAFSVDQYLKGDIVQGERFLFNSRFGKLLSEEISEYLKESVETGRKEPESLQTGLTKKQAMEEAARCLRCDCREIDNCKLRIYSDEYKANQRRFSGPERKTIRKLVQHDTIIFEPAKCIKCGICVDITAEYIEDYGLTFIGRGFDIEIGIPFNKKLEAGLKVVAIDVAKACPTGALAIK